MTLRSCVSAFILIAAFGLMAGKCEQKDYRYVLEKMPDHYRQCAEKVVSIPDGPLTYKQLLTLTVELRKSERRQNRCLKGAIAWADAQWSAYYQHYK